MACVNHLYNFSPFVGGYFEMIPWINHIQSRDQLFSFGFNQCNSLLVFSIWLMNLPFVHFTKGIWCRIKYSGHFSSCKSLVFASLCSSTFSYSLCPCYSFCSFEGIWFITPFAHHEIEFSYQHLKLWFDIFCDFVWKNVSTLVFILWNSVKVCSGINGTLPNHQLLVDRKVAR